eukprot:scaffold3102_cov198-Pinguiococcus_pyrenoidosus.AAC.1
MSSMYYDGSNNAGGTSSVHCVHRYHRRGVRHAEARTCSQCAYLIRLHYRRTGFIDPMNPREEQSVCLCVRAPARIRCSRVAHSFRLLAGTGLGGILASVRRAHSSVLVMCFMRLSSGHGSLRVPNVLPRLSARLAAPPATRAVPSRRSFRRGGWLLQQLPQIPDPDPTVVSGGHHELRVAPTQGFHLIHRRLVRREPQHLLPPIGVEDRRRPVPQGGDEMPPVRREGQIMHHGRVQELRGPCCRHRLGIDLVVPLAPARLHVVEDDVAVQPCTGEHAGTLGAESNGARDAVMTALEAPRRSANLEKPNHAGVLRRGHVDAGGRLSAVDGVDLFAPLEHDPHKAFGADQHRPGAQVQLAELPSHSCEDLVAVCSPSESIHAFRQLHLRPEILQASPRAKGLSRVPHANIPAH